MCPSRAGAEMMRLAESPVRAPHVADVRALSVWCLTGNLVVNDGPCQSNEYPQEATNPNVQGVLARAGRKPSARCCCRAWTPSDLDALLPPGDLSAMTPDGIAGARSASCPSVLIDTSHAVLYRRVQSRYRTLFEISNTALKCAHENTPQWVALSCVD